MSGSFIYNGRVYPYLHDGYNITRFTERAAEIPVAFGLLNNAKCVMEVGAVLPHYLPNWPENCHVCIDLYEQFPYVINADVLTFEPDLLFDLVISISTLDHLKSADEVRAAVARMKSWAAPGGVVFVTLPANQPPEVGGGAWLDDLILSGDLGMEVRRMDKVKPDTHEWQEAAVNDTPSRFYNLPTPFANTVYLLEWLNE